MWLGEGIIIQKERLKKYDPRDNCQGLPHPLSICPPHSPASNEYSSVTDKQQSVAIANYQTIDMMTVAGQVQQSLDTGGAI